MDENLHTTSHHSHLLKWLTYLFWFQLAGLIVPLFSYLPMETGWITWVRKAITLGSIVCLFQLAPGGIRYRRSAIARAVVFSSSLVTTLVISPIQIRIVTGGEDVPMVLTAATSVLNLGVMVFSWIATYQEYRAHATLITPVDPGLSQKWNGLFWWGMAAAVLTSLGSMIVVLLELGVTAAASAATSLVQLPSKIISIVYLVFLNRMIRLFRT